MPGERVAVLLTNDAALECVLTAVGAAFRGAAAVPCNPRWAAEELHHALSLSEPSLLVSDASGAAKVARHFPALPGLTVGPDGDVLAAPAGDNASVAPAADSLLSLLFTSGTTARSKAVMHSHATTLAAGGACAAALGLRAEDLYQGAFPFFTSSALNIACAACWSVGAGFVMEHPLDNLDRLRLIEEAGTTFYHGVPSVLHFMAETAAKTSLRPTRLRRIAFGGAPMPPETRTRLKRLWPGAEQVQIYGSTESGPAGTVIAEAEMDTAPAMAVGRAMPGYRIRVVDQDWRDVPAGEAGEVVLEGPGVALGYWRNAEATAKAFRGRAVRMGDAGYLSADGILVFEDRAGDRINRGGLKVSSVAVEAALLRHPDVLEAAVVAVPHPALGQDVAACLVLRPGATATEFELAAFCRDKLADYEIPRRWRMLPNLPKNAMGKVLKQTLRDRLERAASAPPR